MLALRPEDILTFHRKTVTDSDTGQTDGTKYFPDDGYWEMEHHRRFAAQITDTPGVAGTNTYTFEASLDASNWVDKTNDWFGSANFTTSVILDQSTPSLFKYGRIKRVRSSDGGNNDGGSVISLNIGD